MTTDLRDMVLAALNKATGLLNIPEFARTVLSGRDLTLDQIEMDSMTMMEVIMYLEERLGIDLEADKISEQGSVNQLVEYLRARIDVPL
jgi:acyl carrier protein